MGRFDEIMKGLNEAIEYESGGSVPVKINRLSVQTVSDFSPDEIKAIRLNAEMTQSIFAACIGVTKKAVEAWEGGRSKPDGAARRTLGLMKNNPRFADEMGIIIR